MLRVLSAQAAVGLRRHTASQHAASVLRLRRHLASALWGPKDLLGLLAPDVKITERQAERMLERWPALAKCGEATTLSAVAFLRDTAGVEADTMAVTVRQHPELLTAMVEFELAPALAALQEVLPEELAQSVVKNYPEVLLHSPTEIRRYPKSFQQMGLDLEKICGRTPRIMVRDLLAIERVFAFLLDAKVGPGMPHEQAVHVASSFPMLLIGTIDPERQLGPIVRFFRDELDIDPASEDCIGFYAWPDTLATIHPTALYLMDVCGFSAQDLREDVGVLRYSLEARVQPRTLWAAKLGAQKPTLKTLTLVDDEQFCLSVGSDLEAYHEFTRSLRKGALHWQNRKNE